MKSRHKRLILVGISLSALVLATWLILGAFQNNLVFFFTPTQVFKGDSPKGKTFRLGGMVEPHSLQRQSDGVGVSFIVTDTVEHITVVYQGILPDLFKEGKGVVSQGKLRDDGIFIADEVLAKHDENYMPPEAAYAIKSAQDEKSNIKSDYKNKDENIDKSKEKKQ